MPEPTLPLDTVLEGDCRDILPTLPERSVDMVFADPPYNLQLSQDLFRPNMTPVDAVRDAWDAFPSFQAYDEFSRQWLQGCRRLLKDSGTLWVIGTYHNIFRLGALIQDLGFWILNDVIWIKTNPMPNFRGVRLTNAHETLIWAAKRRGSRYTFNHHALKALNDDLQMRSDWTLPICSGLERLRANGRKVHPTQKPEALLYRVLLASTRAGDVVLDPFFGTGTTGVVAKRLGRHWVGIEREPAYVALARDRIAAEPTPLFLEPITAVEKGRQEKRRLPFGSLLEAGLLRPGDRLWFGGKKEISAVVRADGKLTIDAFVGSIHQAGRHLTGAPCNGWEHWYYEAESGELRRIDDLRQRLLAESEEER